MVISHGQSQSVKKSRIKNESKMIGPTKLCPKKWCFFGKKKCGSEIAVERFFIALPETKIVSPSQEAGPQKETRTDHLPTIPL